MSNRLAHETSPYLRQHAENPVDWFPWGDEAFEVARGLDRPVLLSVGYSSCHWCHVMAHESFENDAVAARMNEVFVNVKVDREERPDVDAIYMEATQAMTGRGGWPMTVVMDPDGRPFFCGTYFPPEPRSGQPGFPQIIDAIEDVWQNRRDELLEQADRVVEAISRQPGMPVEADLPGPETLSEATMTMLAALDPAWGGFGRAPKFPQVMAIGHLLRQYRRSGSTAVLDAVTTSLDAMASGGIHDHLGGGFSRYSVDERWLVPHFEKMLYDNALLAGAYLDAWQLTGEPRYLQVLTDTVEYVLTDLRHPDGGFYSAQDADSLPVSAETGEVIEGAHPEEGAFYLWTPAQVAAVLTGAGLQDHIDDTLEFYGITPGGNFEGASIPNRLHHRGELARPAPIEAARQALLAARHQRPHPGLDDKVLTEWNALMLASLARAATATGEAAWLRAATANAEFLCDNLRVPDQRRPGRSRWLRSWQAADGGVAKHLAYAADHAALVEAFIEMYSATGAQRWLDEALSAAEDLLELFWDPDGGVWSTGDDAETLITRPKDLTDNATPSANSLAATGLLRLEALTGESRYGEHARTILRLLGPSVARHALAFGHLLWAVELHVEGIDEVVITGERPDLVRAVWSTFTPDAVLVWGERGTSPLWDGRDEEGAAGQAYVCRNQTCAAPVDTGEDLVRLLRP